MGPFIVVAVDEVDLLPCSGDIMSLVKSVFRGEDAE
jgi:hypothetical protein